MYSFILFLRDTQYFMLLISLSNFELHSYLYFVQISNYFLKKKKSLQEDCTNLLTSHICYTFVSTGYY